MKTLPLAGQNALVTGAAKRIGRAIALAFADEGANVVLHYRSSEDEARELAAEIEKRGCRTWLVRADLESLEDAASLLPRAWEAAGKLSILVNSAAIFRPDTLATVTLESVTEHLQVNAWAPFLLMRAFAERATSGKIVNLLDTRVDSFDFGHVGYILSKHALAELTRMAALEYAPRITVNAVAPGLILPPPGEGEDYLERMKDSVPLHRHGDADDIARAVLMLAASDFITGEILHVDGGRHLWGTHHGSQHHMKGLKTGKA